MRPRKLLIIGNYGAGNLGDDAILGGIVTDLKTIGFEGTIAVTHGGVPTSREIYKGLKKIPFFPSGLRSRLNSKKSASCLELATSDLVILGGGGLFVDQDSLRAPFIWYSQAKACWKAKKDYICYGQSVGQLGFFLNRWMAKRVFKKAKAVLVRDQASVDLLKSWGITSVLGVDPALSWLMTEKRKVPRKTLLLVVLRLWKNVGEEMWALILKELRVFAKRKNLKLLLAGFDAMDEEEKSMIHSFEKDYLDAMSARLAFEAIEKSELVLSMRLHGGIFALAAGTPFVSLAYTQKVSTFWAAMKVKGAFGILKPEEWTPEKIRETLKSVWEQRNNGLSWDAESGLSQNQAFLRHSLDLD